ncbi:hypothetical protein [Streptomyces sp. GC420]|uniref:hypothetical protein n=1 Tax=Streptomyces sp. GC420 TaxID=2697568 RepID=UPI001414E071|nr:hypothetical protein [Streptomyces sp. GC420]NBM19364.1 hypothetical protein [Streptomyces sp. GC420]
MSARSERKRSRLGILAAASAGALAVTTLALAPAAQAVEPTAASIGFDCGTWGSGTADLTATQNGTAATITLTTDAITAPIALSAGSVRSTLTLTRNGSGTTTFTGRSNPAMAAGDPVSSGPLSGTVAAGDSLEATSLTVVVFGISVTCSATTPQNPGPFVFS